MPQFHETGYGREFLEGDFPRLVQANEKIARQLEVGNLLKLAELETNKVQKMKLIERAKKLMEE